MANYETNAFNLHAIIITDITEGGDYDVLLALIYADGRFRLKFPSGTPHDFRHPEPTISNAIEGAMVAIRAYAESAKHIDPKIEIHHAPPELTSATDIMRWMADHGLILQIIADDDEARRLVEQL